MFEGFEQERDPTARRRLFASSGASLVLFLTIGGGLVAVAGGRVVERKPPPVQVAFHKPAPPPKAPPPPPPPPPKARAKKATVAGNAPATPDQLSDERLAEADESGFQSQLDTLGTDAIVQAGGTVETVLAPPPPRVKRSAPLELPEDAIAPVPSADNARPGYPDGARKQGLEGVVVLRILVSAEGAVEDVEVLAGQEPFVGTALAAVRGWRYQPARIAGRPAAVHREIRLPFRLRRG